MKLRILGFISLKLSMPNSPLGGFWRTLGVLSYVSLKTADPVYRHLLILQMTLRLKEMKEFVLSSIANECLTITLGINTPTLTRTHFPASLFGL